MKARAINNKVLIWNLEKGERRTAGGIVLTDDDRRAEGVRPRWAQVYAVGPDVKDDEIVPGVWVLVEHGRWTRGMEVIGEDGEPFTVWGVEWPDPFLMVSDEQPVEFAARYS
jgi:co-chaperonin GroES (HSP10)